MPTMKCIHCNKPEVHYIEEINGHACFNDQCDVYCNIIDYKWTYVWDPYGN